MGSLFHDLKRPLPWVQTFAALVAGVALWWLMNRVLHGAPLTDAELNNVRCNRYPTATRIHAGLFLFFAFFVLPAIWLRPSASSPPPRSHRFNWIVHLAPAWAAMGTTTLLLGGLWAAGFLAPSRNVIGGNGGTSPAQQAARDALAKLHALAGSEKGLHLDADTAALALWACMFALTVGAAIVALCFAARIFAETRNVQFRRWAIGILVTVSGLFALALSNFALSGAHAGFDGLFGAALFCGTWERILGPEPYRLAMMSDSLNIFGTAIPMAIAVSASLLMSVLTLEVDAGPSIENKEAVRDIAFASRRLDLVLYIGAAALVAGTLQVSAMYALATAHLPTINDVKTRRDICRAAASEVGGTSVAASHVCTDLKQQLEQADAAAGIRQHARSVTLTFGICFSMLLAAIYVTAGSLLAARASKLISGGPATHKVQQKLIELGIESDVIGKFGKLAATLSPVAAGLVSNMLSTG